MPQKELLRKPLKSGWWNSESEIVRYGIDLVRGKSKENNFSPYPENVLAEAYGKLNREAAGPRSHRLVSCREPMGYLAVVVSAWGPVLWRIKVDGNTSRWRSVQHQ